MLRPSSSLILALALFGCLGTSESLSPPTPWPIVDTPNFHNMWMLGTEVLYLSHMPIFWLEDHHYQLTLQARLDPVSWQLYLNEVASFPGVPLNLANNDAWTLPQLVSGEITEYKATLYRGYSNANGGTQGPQITNTSTVYIERVVYWRAFDSNIPRPIDLTYVLFGNAKQAFLDHYVAADPDYQHLALLSEVPSWLSTSQLKAGVTVSFQGLPTKFSCHSPLANSTTYTVLFQGIESAVAQVTVDRTFWFSAGNLLNAQGDPCPNAV